MHHTLIIMEKHICDKLSRIKRVSLQIVQAQIIDKVQVGELIKGNGGKPQHYIYQKQMTGNRRYVCKKIPSHNLPI